MEENSNNKQTYQVIDMSDHESKNKKSSHTFSKSVLLPFCSGVLGATLVIGTCFGVPEIRSYFIGQNSSIQTSSPSRK